jgi:hypothetical protein
MLDVSSDHPRSVAVAALSGEPACGAGMPSAQEKKTGIATRHLTGIFLSITRRSATFLGLALYFGHRESRPAVGTSRIERLNENFNSRVGRFSSF